MNDDVKEQMEAQEEQRLRATAAESGLRRAADEQLHTIHNEAFLAELRKADVDGDLEERYPEWFSGAHAVTNRGDDWDLQSDLLMMNKRERAVAERRPGRLLRDRPFLRAVMNGDEAPGLEAFAQPGIPGTREEWMQKLNGKDTSDAPVDSAEKRKIYEGAEVAADLMSLARNAAGLEAVSTVKTETNVRRQEQEESTASRIGKVFE